MLSPKTVNNIRISALTTAIQPHQRVLHSAIRQEKEIKGIQIQEKNSMTISVHRQHYNEKQKESTKKLQEYISGFSKAIKKYQLHVYILAMSSWKLRQTKKQSSCTSIKILRDMQYLLNLTKYVQDL